MFARATGVVAERRVDIGDRVRRGDILAVVAAPEIDQAVDRARHRQPDQGQGAARRHQLHAHAAAGEQGFLSRQVLDEHQGTYDVDKADRQVAEAELRRLAEIQRFQMVRARSRASSPSAA